MQEVFQSDLVFPQDGGELQFTLTPRFSGGNNKDSVQVPLEIEYGITDQLQVEFGGDMLLTYFPEESNFASGFGDIKLGLIYSFMNISDKLFHVTLGAGVDRPTGDVDKELG